MKCPACLNILKEWKVGTIAVDVCDGGCGGVWFDAFELQKAGQASETVSETLRSVERNQDLLVDTSAKRECPRCAGIKLKKHPFSRQTPVQVEQCPSCGGYWLDYGELSVIQLELGGKTATQPVKSEMSMEVIRFLYRMKTRHAEDSTPPPSQ